MNRIVSRASVSCEWALRQPIVWGALACLAFYALAAQRFDPEGAMRRYLVEDAWPWKAAVCWLFFTAAAQLGSRLLSVIVQWGALEHRPAQRRGDEPLSPAGAGQLLADVQLAPASLQEGYLLRRLRRALEWVKLRESADGLDVELNQLARDDRRRMTAGYDASRALVAAVIVVGLTGSLVAASTALGTQASLAADESLPLVAALATACDPAVGALMLALALVAVRFAVARFESRLLDQIDRVVDAELLGRFGPYAAEGDPHSASIARMSEKVLQTVAAAAKEHDAALHKSLATANRRWEEMASSAASLLQRAMTAAIAEASKEHAAALNLGVAKHAADLEGVLIRHAEILSDGVDRQTASLAEALEHHAAVLTVAERKLAEENCQHLTEVEASLGEAMLVAATRQEKLVRHGEELIQELQVALVEATGTAVVHQEQLVKQSELLLKVIEAAGRIRSLEETLNSNLSALAAAHGFEETAASLAAAVQLLAARQRQPNLVHAEVALGDDNSASQAA